MLIDKLAKIEDKLNKGLSQLFGRVFAFISKLVPQTLVKAWVKFSIQVRQKLKLAFEKLKLGVFLTFQIIQKVTNLFFNTVDKIQNFPIKQKIFTTITTTQSYLFTNSPKQHISNIKQLFIKIYQKANLKLQNLVPEIGIKTPLILGSIILLGALGIYSSLVQIYNTEQPSRSIASVQEYDYRPEYRLYPQQTLTIQNIKVPIFVESVGEIDSITIDFSVRTSTRFARYYLLEYDYKLKDYFFTTVEPVISNFPIETEGKEVLKEKIRIEINNFLHENYVEGEVEEVNILYIVGS